MKPMTLLIQTAPFNDPDWLFEVKFDGFRALAYVENGSCELISRNDNIFQRFKNLGESLAAVFAGRNVVIDGEIVSLDDQGRPQFYDLMHGRGTPHFYAFDLLYLSGLDLREQPLVERKALLRELIPETPSRLLYVDHFDEKGIELFEKVREWDLEGIVAKPRQSAYNTKRKSCWIKINNPNYSQAEGRQELFDRRLSDKSIR
jgi:bifunctional non-homologous end joining protein LigD